jgi:hypothetical protein
MKSKMLGSVRVFFMFFVNALECREQKVRVNKVNAVVAQFFWTAKRFVLAWYLLPLQLRLTFVRLNPSVTAKPSVMSSKHLLSLAQCSVDFVPPASLSQ